MERKSLQRFRFFRKLLRFWKHFRDGFAASLDVNVDRKVELSVDLSKSATLRDVVYWLQILFSAGIATLGLVLNSSAVIIGAMLISPLMGPILSAGLALATGDLILAFRAVTNLALSVLIAVGFAVLLVAFIPFKDGTAEIAARTSPNTLDLVIALFSGAIGSIATCRRVKGVVTSIPGVAIAVALMPPLCVVGYGIGVAVSQSAATGLPIAGGGGLLFLTNLVAITLMAMLVFVFLRIDTSQVREKLELWRGTDREHLFWCRLISTSPQLEKARQIRSFSLRLLMILIPLLIISIPLSQSYATLRDQIATKQTQNKISGIAREVWTSDYVKDSENNIRSYLDELKVEQEGEKVRIFMRVFDNVPYTQAERTAYISRVAEKLNMKPESLSLQLIEIPTSAMDRFTPVIETTPTPLTVAQTQQAYLQEIATAFQRIDLPEPAAMIDYSITLSPDRITNFQINYLSARDIDPDGKNLLLKDLRRRLNIPNLSLSFTRVTGEVSKVLFKRGTAELEDVSRQLLNDAATDMQIHPTLRVRIMIGSEQSEKERTAARKKAVSSIFLQDFRLNEDRIAISEIEGEELSNTIQLFLKR